MAEIASSKLLKKGVEIMSISDFIAKHHPGLTVQGVGYAMEAGKIDYVIMAKDRMVVMTDNTRTYVPNGSKKRKEKMEL